LFGATGFGLGQVKIVLGQLLGQLKMAKICF